MIMFYRLGFFFFFPFRNAVWREKKGIGVSERVEEGKEKKRYCEW